MKSSLILASLITLAFAGPLTPRKEDPCACDFVCVQELEAGCKCQIAAKKKCYADQQAAGPPASDCPKPVISETCQPFDIDILPVQVSTTTTAPSPSSTASPPAKEGEECGTFRGAVCDVNLICVVEDPLCADCAGVCKSDQCGGIQGLACPAGWQCVVDDTQCDENESDCAGKCEQSASR